MAQILVGTLPNDLTGDNQRTAYQKINQSSMPDWFNVKSYGAKGDGSSDDTIAIAAAITAASAAIASQTGGIVYFPPGQYVITSTLTIAADGVQIMGSGWSTTVNTPSSPPSMVKGNNLTGPVFNVQKAGSALQFGVTFTNIGIQGSTDAACTGITFVNCNSWTVDRCFIDNTGSSAIKMVAGAGGYLSNTFCQRALQATQSVDAGAFDLTGTDTVANGCFATASIAQSAGLIGNGHNYAWRWNVANGFATNCMGELSHHGWLIVNGTGETRFEACRAFANQGNGWAITGAGDNTFLACHALANSQTADNTWAGFRVTKGGNVFLGCYIDGNSGDARQQTNGFDDSNTDGSRDDQINYYSCNRIGFIMRGVLYNFTGQNTTRVEHPHSLRNNGDNDFTLFAGVDSPVQTCRSTLTANRTITLSGTGAWQGARFRLERGVASTGAFDWILSGTILPQRLGPGQWCDVEYLAGTGWSVMAFGLSQIGSPTVVLTDAATIATDACLLGPFQVTLLASGHSIGAPSNPIDGQRITHTVIQDGTGGRSLTWNAVFKNAWSDTGNTLSKRSTMSHVYDGTNWNQDGAQTPYV